VLRKTHLTDVASGHGKYGRNRVKMNFDCIVAFAFSAWFLRSKREFSRFVDARFMIHVRTSLTVGYLQIASSVICTNAAQEDVGTGHKADTPVAAFFCAIVFAQWESKQDQPR